MLVDLPLEEFNPGVTLVDLPGHLLHVSPCLRLVPLQVLNLLVSLTELVVDLCDNLVPLALVLMRLLYLTFFRQDIRRNPSVYLAHESAQSAVSRVHLRYLLKRV